MKSLIIFLHLFTCCLQGQTIKSTKNFSLLGSWTINKYVFSDISAMTEKVAQEWKGKKATFTKVIHFPYYDIPTYKNTFANNSFKDNCNCGDIKNRYLHPDTSVSTEKYLVKFKMNSTKLGINKKTILLVRTNCSETPFEEIIVKNNNEIIIFWDGTFFNLTRDK